MANAGMIRSLARQVPAIGILSQPPVGAVDPVNVARDLRMAPPSRITLVALCFAAVASALCPVHAQVALPAGPLRLSERRVNGEETVVVQNAFYEVILRPESGATISSLQFGAANKTQLTAWSIGTRSGLLQETHTADSPFQFVQKDVRADRILLAFEGSREPLSVRKVFEFYRDDPSIKVTMVFENRSPFPLGGAAAPRVSNAMLPARGKATRREYYCLDRGRGAEALTSATVLRELNPLRENDSVLNWIAVTEPVTRKGLGIVFLDSATRHPAAQRNRNGVILTQWQYEPVPAYSSMRTELLLVPLQAFAAISALNADFAADTVTVLGAENGLTISLRLMALRSDMKDMSVVTRVYAADGAEMQPSDTLLFDRIAAYTIESGEVAVLRQGHPPAWLRHEFYLEGKKIGQFVVPVSPEARPPLALGSQVPPASVSPLADLPPEWPDDDAKVANAARDYGFLVRLVQGQSLGPDASPLHIALASAEKETLFFGIRALEPIERLRASISAGAEPPAHGGRPIAPTAAYLWRVEAGEDGSACLVPFEEGEVEPDSTVWVAVTFDAAELMPGRHAARLFVEGGRKPWELPIVLQVSRHRLKPSAGFALWFVDTEPAAGEMEAAVLLKLVSYAASALSLPLSSTAPAESLVGAERRAEAFRLDMLGFYAPGGGADSAERMAAGGALGATFLPLPKPGWLLWAGTDDLGSVGRLRELGFEPAVVFPRLPGLGKATQGGLQEAPKHWLVEAGCATGEVPALLNGGHIRSEDSVWLYLDLRRRDWPGATLEVRSAFWAAAWQGLAGAAIRCPRPLKPVDRQSVLWHILRDAREEAVLVAEALQEGQTLRKANLAGDSLNLKRTAALEDLRRLVGRQEDCLMQIETARVPFRDVLRASGGRSAAGSPISSFQAAKGHALRFLESAEELLPKMTRWDNLYWDSTPLLEEGHVRWAIVATSTGAPVKAASMLQRSIERRTGRTVPILTEFPKMQTEAAIEPPRLIWVIADGENQVALPQPVQEATVAAGTGRLRVVHMATGTTAVIMASQTDMQALERTFLAESTLYRPATAVK